MKTREEKLTNIEASISRWITRGLRATNAISKLQKRKQRLLKTPPAKQIVEAKIADTFAPPPSSPPAEDLTVPPFLKREVDVDAMKAKRTASIDKTAMPLTGRDALKAVRRKA